MRAQMCCFVPFISIFYIVGFVLLGYGLRSAHRSTKAADWPSTPGTITQLSVDVISGSEDTTYQVKAQYTYTVDGVAYEGNRLAFGYAATNVREVHDEIHRKLKDAKSVSVRYDPSDPAISCLSYGLHSSIQFTLVFSILWLAFVFGFTLLGWLISRSDRVLLENLSVQ